MSAVQTTRDVEVFLAEAGAWLEACAERTALFLAICAGLRRAQPVQKEGDRPWFAVIREEGEVCAVALHTPPHKVLVTQMSPEAQGLVLEALWTRFPDLPGVLGPLETSERMAQVWAKRLGATFRRGDSMRTFALREVKWPVVPVPGELLPFPEDRSDLLMQWVEAFCVDADLSEPGARDLFLERLKRGSQAWIWQVEGVPVSMAVSSRTEVCSRISGVYTPPGHRRHGYASACVAALSQAELDAGVSFCSLNTNLNNPTSNHIYQVIGYRAVEDICDWFFEACPDHGQGL